MSRKTVLAKIADGKDQYKTGYKIGGIVSTSRIPWAQIDDIDANRRKLYVVDQDGGTNEISFDSVLHYEKP